MGAPLYPTGIPPTSTEAQYHELISLIKNLGIASEGEFIRTDDAVRKAYGDAAADLASANEAARKSVMGQYEGLGVQSPDLTRWDTFYNRLQGVNDSNLANSLAQTQRQRTIAGDIFRLLEAQAAADKNAAMTGTLGGSSGGGGYGGGGGGSSRGDIKLTEDAKDAMEVDLGIQGALGGLNSDVRELANRYLGLSGGSVGRAIGTGYKDLDANEAQRVKNVSDLAMSWLNPFKVSKATRRYRTKKSRQQSERQRIQAALAALQSAHKTWGAERTGTTADSSKRTDYL